MIANVLSIAGLDPSGGAGILADVKTFSALGAYGMAAAAALTAQNTVRVSGFQLVDPAFVRDQIDRVFEDIRVDAVKVGMVGSASIAETVAEALLRHEARRIVVDPVMVAKSGDRLLSPDAVAVIRDTLVPLADVLTPNLPEAGALLDAEPITDLADAEATVNALQALGPSAVLLKGGHAGGPHSTDIYFDGERLEELDAPRIPTKNTHGTGCTLSAAIAALLPGREPIDAVREAKAYVTAAIASANHLDVGGGHGPLHHFHGQWPTTPVEPATG
ncbi:bifunctional hydroxymethylpyrimidine kinase/phosphomethylpyrimidine kinase [Bauldia sp.]|uniref:bifunctional hydroxymethylpyrimidine kinase/phosphomethylpyrimidine kinase n=1 Tax=Bauldia sp. TaxID=2575872 RepID=UPI003BAB8E9A